MMLSRMILIVACVVALTTTVMGQRPFFAGFRPIGYPETSEDNIPTEGLGNRFGEANGTTPKIPIEANGDLGLIDRLSKLPIDKQPFWFINWQALEAHRNKPQTYPQRPSGFVDPVPNNQNIQLISTAQSNPNSESNLQNRFSNSNSGNVNTAITSSGNDPNKIYTTTYIYSTLGSVTPTSKPSTSATVSSNSNTPRDITKGVLTKFELNEAIQSNSPQTNDGTKKFIYY